MRARAHAQEDQLTAEQRKTLTARAAEFDAKLEADSGDAEALEVRGAPPPRKPQMPAKLHGHGRHHGNTACAGWHFLESAPPVESHAHSRTQPYIPAHRRARR